MTGPSVTTVVEGPLSRGSVPAAAHWRGRTAGGKGEDWFSALAGRSIVSAGDDRDFVGVHADGVRDTIDCGAGRDTVEFYNGSEVQDTLRNCERFTNAP